MDDLIQKYLDGDLTEEEAAVFEEELASDPKMEADLHAYERILALAAGDIARDPSAGFTDRVMERVAAARPRRSSIRAERPAFWRGVSTGTWAWGTRLAWTAGFALVFALGYVTARNGWPGSAGPTLDVASGPGQAGQAVEAASAPQTLRLVRLIYVPPSQDVESVTVAGTFNGWNPNATAMLKEGEAWVVQLVLPPDSYEYMFIEDGEKWVTDPLAFQTRDDGFGRKNAVLDLTL